MVKQNLPMQICPGFSVRILGDEEKYLAKMNRAGLPVLKRLETWALTAVDGKPFQKALDWVKEKQALRVTPLRQRTESLQRLQCVSTT